MGRKSQYPEGGLIIAQKEELGNPALFTGREAELEFFLDWAENSKREISRSHAMMARKRRGKTALVQRLFNILYTRNDPQIVPFYYRIPDWPMSMLEFGDQFYRSLISQYLAFKLRRPEYVRRTLGYDRLRELVADDAYLSRDVSEMARDVTEGNATTVAIHAREAGEQISVEKDVRILQFIDEFQFLNEYIYREGTAGAKALLAQPYQHTGSSRISPQLITGSYVGWLSIIVRRMVDRYREIQLKPLPPEEALALVYNYSTVYRVPVSDSSAAYMIEVCENDPFYIAALFESHALRDQQLARDLSSRDAVRKILSYEITEDDGQIRKMWQEYTWHAFHQTNDKNAKRIVLYLTRFGGEERTRKQILEDLELELTDQELETLMHKLVRADMISQGQSSFDFKGLGDSIFEMVFRHVYQREIDALHERETVASETIREDINRQLKAVKGELAYRKGQVAEYRMVNQLLMAMVREVPLDRLVRHVPKGVSFGPFTSIRKKAFHLDQDRWVEVDVYCQAEDPAHTDLAIEVKDRATVSQAELEKFVKTRESLLPLLTRPTAFLFHSEQGSSEEQERYLAANGVMCSDGKSITANSQA